ncbi:MAG: hypothetical protein ACPL4E_08390 [Thermoproteota archaeon]
MSIWIEDGDGAIESLNRWLSRNAKDLSKMSALEKLLMKIGGDATKGVGVKIGYITDNFLNIKDEYGENVAEALLDTVLKNPDALEEVLTKLNSFKFEEEQHRVMLRKGKEGTLDMGKGNEVRPGTYAVKVYWEYGEKDGVIEFSIVKDVESERISIPREQVDQILSQIGSYEAQVSVSKAELFDYRLLFPTEFFVKSKRIRIDLFNNEMEIDGMHYKFSTNPDVHEGRIRVDVEFEGKNIGGKNLMLSFYEDGEVRIKYGYEARPIEKIEVDATRSLMRIEYLKSEEKMAEYSFNSKPLSEQMGKISCEILLEEGQDRIRLKEWLFRLLGYDALEELKERISKEISKDRRVILLVHFDNNKVVYCGSKELRVSVQNEARSITSIEIVAYKELMSLKQLAVNALDNPENTYWKGMLGEAIINEKFINALLEEASKRSGVPKEKIKIEWFGEKRLGEEVPDLVMKNAEADRRIVIVEVKYVSDPEDVEDFGKQLNEAKKDVQRYLNDPEWKADHGVIAIVAWPPEWILSNMPYPTKVGEFNNPYIEWISREGG